MQPIRKLKSQQNCFLNWKLGLQVHPIHGILANLLWQAFPSLSRWVHLPGCILSHKGQKRKESCPMCKANSKADEKAFILSIQTQVNAMENMVKPGPWMFRVRIPKPFAFWLIWQLSSKNKACVKVAENWAFFRWRWGVTVRWPRLNHWN